MVLTTIYKEYLMTMYRQHCSPNPYVKGQGPASPMDGNFTGFNFKPRGGANFQSSPRYHQQFAPPRSQCSPQAQNHGRSPRYNQASPRGQDHSGYRSPFQSPPHNSFEGSGYSSHNHSHNNSYSGDRNFNRQSNQWGDRNKRQMHNSRSEQDSNPGGSNDIRQYYNPTMLQDPWANLQPVPVCAAQSSPPQAST